MLMTLRLPENTLHAIEHYAQTLNMTKSAYVKHCIAHMNQTYEQKNKREQLQKASQKVREQSLAMCQEWESLHDSLG